MFGLLLVASLISCWLVACRREVAFADVKPATVAVRPGDSLWAIASEHGVEGATTQEVVSWMMGQNKLDTAAIDAGMLLVVPDQTVS